MNSPTGSHHLPRTLRQVWPTPELLLGEGIGCHPLPHPLSQPKPWWHR